jgi:hypothetical protein
MGVHGFYWSVEACGWVACPDVGDALATPWAAHGMDLLVTPPAPVDGHAVLRTVRPPLDLPGQRPDAVPAAPEPLHAPT